LGVSLDGAAGVGGAAGMKKAGMQQTEDYIFGGGVFPSGAGIRVRSEG